MTLLGPLIAAPSFASPPCFPDYVQAYFDNADLNYSLPRGKFEPYLVKYYAEHNIAAPWAITGDFNGDGIEDWAGLARSGENKLDLVTVVSSGGDYGHHLLTPLGSDDDGIYFGVELEPPGKLEGFPLDDEVPEPSISIENTSIHLFYFEKSSVLYYFRDNEFHEFWTSD